MGLHEKIVDDKKLHPMSQQSNPTFKNHGFFPDKKARHFNFEDLRSIAKVDAYHLSREVGGGG